MRKNFFKKLSFVLALAMIISVIAPAAGAFAATAPKLNSVKKYLHLDKPDYNEFNFNISGKKSGWKYDWTSANEDVAVVDDANGVTTATGVGSTKISVVITNKDGEEQAELAATVVVRDNIISVAISNAPEGNKLAIGANFDFNRSFTTVSGSTTKTSAVTRWSIDKEGAKISDSGLFTATVAGTFSVVAKSFQSVEKYNLYKADPTTNASYLLATSVACVVTVAPTMTAAKQLTAKTAKLVFDADMSKELTKDNLKAYRVIAGVSQPVDILVSKVTFDATGKEATVEMFVDMIGGENYKFVYGTMEAGFVAAKADADQVVTMVIDTKEAVYTAGAKTLAVKLYNADGVEITTSALTGRVTYSLENNVGYLNAGTLLLFAKGDVASIKATFHTYKYDSSYNEIVVTATGNVVAVDATSYNLGTTTEWTLATGTAPDWSKAKVTTLAAGDSGYSVFTRVKSTKTTATEYFYNYDGFTAGTGVNDDKFSFSSSNPDVLIVDTYGTVYPAKAGSAVIICYYGTGSDLKAIATFPVEVVAARAASVFSLDKTALTVSNTWGFADTATVKLALKDQLGADFLPVADTSKFEIIGLKSNPDLGAGFGPVGFSSDRKSILVNGQGQTKGTWTYQIKAYDKVVILTVNVQEPTLKTPHISYIDDVSYFRLTLDKTAVDRAVSTSGAIKTVTPTLIGYASNGIAVYKSTWLDGFTYTVEKVGTTGAVALDSFNLTDGTIEVVAAATGGALSTPTAVASGAAITAVTGTNVVALAKDATYLVTAYQGTVVKGTATFTVTDTKVAPSYVLEKSTTDQNLVLDAVRDCFKVTLSGSDIPDGTLYKVVYAVNGVEKTDLSNNDLIATAGTDVYVKSVNFVKTFTVDNGGGTYAVEYTVNIGRTINFK